MSRAGSHSRGADASQPAPNCGTGPSGQTTDSIREVCGARPSHHHHPLKNPTEHCAKVEACAPEHTAGSNPKQAARSRSPDSTCRRMRFTPCWMAPSMSSMSWSYLRYRPAAVSRCQLPWSAPPVPPRGLIKKSNCHAVRVPVPRTPAGHTCTEPVLQPRRIWRSSDARTWMHALGVSPHGTRTPYCGPHAHLECTPPSESRPMRCRVPCLAFGSMYFQPSSWKRSPGGGGHGGAQGRPGMC